MRRFSQKVIFCVNKRLFIHNSLNAYDCTNKYQYQVIMDLLVKFLRLDWWVYIVVVVTFFSVALFLNYVVKKINEARFEERLVKIQDKVLNTQSIQVQRRTESRLAPRVPLEIVLEQSNPPTVKGISLVFDKKDKSQEQNKDRFDIKNFPNAKNLTTVEVTNISAANDVAAKISENDIVAPTFLGKIYNELCVIEKSKSMTNAEKYDIKNEIVNLLDFKKQESKSAPSVKKLLENQNKEDFKRRSLKFVGEDIVSGHKPTTSTVLVEE